MNPVHALSLDRDFILADVPARLFGSFAEHLGRSIYGGLYEPGHPLADAHGFRRDVIALTKELGVTVVRYPGGNFVSGYNWEDGVGPRDKRPVRRDLAWMTTESNQFGTDEFVQWCRLAEVEPMLACNLGTRGPKEAGEYAEYCNHPSGTALSDLRVAHGHKEPHNVKLWCLGNEMDGPWQMGNLPADEYGRKAREAAKLIMSSPDPITGGQGGGAEFIVCGSSARAMSSYASWDQAVLEECFERVQYLSVHSYVDPTNIDVATELAFPETMGKLIREITAICDAVAAKRKSDRRIHLSYDEWNVWYMNRVRSDIKPWASAPPLLEDVYTMADALCVGGMLITLLNHCDRVRIACQAQLVNVIGPIMTRTGGPAWRQTIFHPFAQASKFGRGDALRQAVRGTVPTVKAGNDEMPAVLTACVANPDGGLTIFALNRDLARPIDLRVSLHAFAGLKSVEWTILRDDDLKAVNTEQAPHRIAPKAHAGATVADGQLTATLPPASWNVIRVR
jgi:alpha-N-arabinofuranosidase